MSVAVVWRDGLNVACSGRSEPLGIPRKVLLNLYVSRDRMNKFGNSYNPLNLEWASSVQPIVHSNIKEL